MRVDGDIHLTVAFGLIVFLALLLHGNRLAEQLDVHVVAYRFHMPVLLRAQQITGAPNLQVPHGDLEAGTELGEFADRGKPAFRDL